MEASQKEQNNAHEPPGAPFTEQLRSTSAPTSTRPFQVVIVSESFPEVLCQLPVLSGYSPVCARELDYPKKPAINADFITLARLQSRLEYVLEDTASSPAVAENIKDSAMDLRDLIAQVRISSLVRKDILGRELELFVDDAKAAGGSLQELSGHVWGVVDQILSLNDHILIVLEISGGPLSSAIKFLLPFGRETSEVRQRRTESLWLQAIELLDRNLGRLIHQAEANIDLLRILEERLNTIQDMTVTEEETLRGEEEELKRQWFSDAKKMKSYSNGFKLLLEVRDHRKHALSQVTGVLLKLNQMSNDLGDLRERVAAPVIAGSSNIPIEAHIKSIQRGTERLVHGQTRMREIEDAYRQKKFCSSYST
ncbi:hypothetical protein V565_050650 [Rhizoctonia solani 123E]|uniref:Uncharacterized protein n=1 Tax=Rhizoctonia solani 123E TaxID=1423351 RepID=A0A074SQ23_9AGAM|nr:hypothetical protein V565_050650 [Rhizoctonia solani 123E]